jgi:hypothetical protein
MGHVLDLQALVASDDAGFGDGPVPGSVVSVDTTTWPTINNGIWT